MIGGSIAVRVSPKLGGTGGPQGFSLLEVLIAMAILAVALTALFSSEAGAVKMAYRARRIGIATQLARCKMGEIEEQIALEGLPAVSDVGSDECCEDAEIDGFNCDWEIERIVLPDSMFEAEEGEEDALAGLAGDKNATATDKADSILDVDPASMLSGDQGGMGSMAGMAMSYVFPILKPALEEQIRRATVTVRWNEGSRPLSFDVTQYLVAEQPTQAANPNGPGSAGTTPATAPATGNAPGGGAPGTPFGGGLLGGGRR